MTDEERYMITSGRGSKVALAAEMMRRHIESSYRLWMDSIERHLSPKAQKHIKKKRNGSHRRWIEEGRRLAKRDYIPVYDSQSAAVSFGEETISPPSFDNGWINEIK